MHRQVFQPPRGETLGPCWEPPVDVLETEHEVLVFVALPGVDPAGVEARIEDGQLVVSGRRILPPELRRAVIHRLELPQGRFERRDPAARRPLRGAPRGGLRRPRLHAREARPGRDAMNLLENDGPERAAAAGGGCRARSAAVPLPEDALILLPVRDTGALPGNDRPDRGRPPGVGRRGAAGGPRGAPGRRRPAARPGGGRARPGRPPPHRHRRQHPALHDGARRHAITSSARACSASASSTCSRGRRSRSRGSSASRRRRAGCPRSRAASSTSRRWRSRRSGSCRRRRRACSSRCGRSPRPPRSPTSRPPTSTSSRRRSRRSSRRSTSARAWTGSRGCSPSASRCCGISHEIGRQTKAAFDERQREAVLREQMAAIQRQLGEGDGKAEEVAELSEAIAKAGMPEEVEAQARKELRRYERMPEAAGEAGMVRTYLDWLIELPWKLPEEKPIDIAEARAILDEDHYGLEKIKTPHHRISGDAQAGAGGQGADPLLRRPARRRQDLARPVDRPRHGPAVRAREPRRRARRGRDPRPPPHLYRRAARQHHPGDPQGAAPATA